MFRLIIASVSALAMSLPVGVQAQHVIHSERSLYRNILVYETTDLRCLTFTRLLGPAGPQTHRQTCVDLHNPEKVVFNYVKMLAGVLFVNPAPMKILIIGLGGGTIPKIFESVLPNASIEVVEIDPSVIKIAHQYFDYHENNKTSVNVEDGRVFIKRAKLSGKQYDVIVLDAFTDEYIPEHMMTREFLQQAKDLLRPNGVLAANTFCTSLLYDNESVTYQSVFPRFFNLRTNNRVIIARNGELPSYEQLEENAAKVETLLKPFGISVDALLPLFSLNVDWRTDARILTDQYSPSNLLLESGRTAN